MRIGIGLPNAVPGVTGDLLARWAARAERAGFSSVAAIDELVAERDAILLALDQARAGVAA